MIKSLLIFYLIFYNVNINAGKYDQQRELINLKREAINAISDAATKFCKDIELNGNSESLEISGNSKIKLNSIFNKIIGLGAEGNGKYKTNNYKGLPQDQLSDQIEKNNNCRTNIFEQLKDDFFDQIKTFEKTPTHPLPSSFYKKKDNYIFNEDQNLMWSNEVKHLSWNDAKKYAKYATFMGHNNWRLPTKNELLEIAQYAHNKPKFFSGDANWFWSNESADNFSKTKKAWIVNGGNAKDYDYKEEKDYKKERIKKIRSVRLVRVNN